MHSAISIELIEESIRLEMNAAELYQVFSETLPEDSEFWWQLHLEERSHAALIRAARDSFANRGRFPADMVSDSVYDLKAANARIAQHVAECRLAPLSRWDACKLAIAIEEEAGETHYLRFMEKEPTNPVETVFQQLNRTDIEHQRRIRDHLAALPASA